MIGYVIKNRIPAMSDQKKSKHTARRSLLKSVVAGGGVFAVGKMLPESWTRPVVQSVALPAHAQTSPFSGPVGNFGAAAAAGSLGFNDRGRSILDLFVQPAHAAPAYSATLGNVAFDAYWTVREDDAVVCGEALYTYGNATVSPTFFHKTVSRSGDWLGDFSHPVGPDNLAFTNQRVSEGGVDLSASTHTASGPFFAPIGGTGCVGNVTFSTGTSSPYAEDEELV